MASPKEQSVGIQECFPSPSCVKETNLFNPLPTHVRLDAGGRTGHPRLDRWFGCVVVDKVVPHPLLKPPPLCRHTVPTLTSCCTPPRPSCHRTHPPPSFPHRVYLCGSCWDAVPTTRTPLCDLCPPHKLPSSVFWCCSVFTAVSGPDMLTTRFHIRTPRLCNRSGVYQQRRGLVKPSLCMQARMSISSNLPHSRRQQLSVRRNPLHGMQRNMITLICHRHLYRFHVCTRKEHPQQSTAT